MNFFCDKYKTIRPSTMINRTRLPSPVAIKGTVTKMCQFKTIDLKALKETVKPQLVAWTKYTQTFSKQYSAL